MCPPLQERQTGFHPVWDKKVEKNPSLVLIYGSVELYRFIRRKKTVGVNFRILSEKSLQLKKKVFAYFTTKYSNIKEQTVELIIHVGIVGKNSS
jgi:hypothetical protein